MASYNHPYAENVSISNTRELLTDYGFSCVTDLDEHVHIPLEDKVMGQTLVDNKSIKAFHLRVSCIKRNKKRYKQYDTVSEILAAVEVDRENGLEDSLAELTVDTHIDAWFKDTVTQYEGIKDCLGPKFNNYKYAGGCLAALPKDDSHFYTVSANKINFKTLQLRQVAQKSEGVLQGYDVHRIGLPDPIYGVQGKQVQGEGIISVRTAEQCYMYKIHTDSDNISFKEISQVTKHSLCSVDISPYIPGECVMVDEAGNCCLLSNEKLDVFAESLQPRFQVSDPWRHVQYGSHPRQVIYADQTVVQILDLRVPGSEGQDLFSLPSTLLHKRERIRLCGSHPVSPFYHIMATDYNMIVLDERYTKYPVLRWDHMLSSPPQYMSSIQHDPSLHDDNFIYIASQMPADVHGFRFSLSGTQPPRKVSWPHRSAKIEELCLWPEFVDECPNTDLLRERLSMSSAGFTCMPWKKGHALLQLTCHGDIFHQVFSPTDTVQDVTFSVGITSDNLKPHPVAVDTAKSWIDLWVDQIKSQIHRKATTREIDMDKWGVLFYRKPHKSCCVCRPDLAHMPGVTEGARTTDYCSTCMMTVLDGPDFIQSAEKDRIMPNLSAPHVPTNLEPVEDLPRGTAVTKLICAHWEGDLDTKLDDIMMEWDEEVSVKRKNMKTAKRLPDMTEQSVMDRLTGQTSTQPPGSGRTQKRTSFISFDDISIRTDSTGTETESQASHRTSIQGGQKMSRAKKNATLEIHENFDFLNSGESIVTEIASPEKSEISSVLESVSSFECRMFGSESNKIKTYNLAKKANTALKNTLENSSTGNSQGQVKDATDNRKLTSSKPQTSNHQIKDGTDNRKSTSSFKIPSSVKKSKRKRVNTEESRTDQESVNAGSEELFASPRKRNESEQNVDSSNEGSTVQSVSDLPALKLPTATVSLTRLVEKQSQPSQSAEVSNTGTEAKKARLKSPKNKAKRNLYSAGF